MRLVPLFCVEAEITSALVESGQRTNDDAMDVFPNMRRSGNVLVFSRSYFYDQFTPFFGKWLEANVERQPDGSFYIPSSGMCEVGTGMAVDQLQQSVMHYLGTGPVRQEILDEAKRLGYGDRVPKQRLGDFTPAAFPTNIVVPRGVNLNGVTDGGHSTTMAIVEDEESPTPGELHLDLEGCSIMSWEWENLKWSLFKDAVKRGVIYKDIGT